MSVTSSKYKLLITVKNLSNCDYMQTSMPDFPLSSVGWFYPYDSILQPMFDKYMLELFENGVFDRIVDTILTKQPDCPAETVPKVNFSFVTIIFFILFGGAILSFLILLLEKNGWFSLKSDINWP